MPFPPVPLHRPLANHHTTAILIHAILTHPPTGSLTPFLLINRTFYTALAHLPYTSVQLHEGNVLGFYAGLGGDCGPGAERGDGGKDVRKLGDEDIIRRPSRAPALSAPLLARRLLLISKTVHLTLLDAPSFLLTIHAISLFRKLLVSQLNAHIMHYFDTRNKRLALFQGCEWLVFGEQLWGRIQEEKRGNKVMPRLLIKMGYGWHNASLCVPLTRDKVSRSLVTALSQFLEQDSFRKVVLHGARMEDWCADFGESVVEAYLCEDTGEEEEEGKGSKRDEGVKVWARWIHDLLEHHLDKTTHRHRYLSHQTLLLFHPSTTQSLGEAVMSIPEGRYMTRVVVGRGGLSRKGGG